MRDRRDEADLRPGQPLRDRRVRQSSLDQIGPFARDVRDAAALLHAVAGRDERDSTSAPVPVPDELLAPARDDDEAAAGLRGKRLGLPREYFVAGHGARRRGAGSGRPSRRSRRPGASVEEVSLPHTDYGLATYYIVAPGRGVGQPGPLRRHPVRAAAAATADVLGQLPRDARAAASGPEVKRRIMLGTYALSAGYYDAYYLKAQKVRTLIKGDFDALCGRASTRSSRRPRPTVAFRVRRADGRPGRDVPLRRLHAAGQHGRAAGDLDPVRPVGGPAGRAPAHRGGLVRAGAAALARAYEALTAAEEWRSLEPTAPCGEHGSRAPTPQSEPRGSRRDTQPARA